MKLKVLKPAETILEQEVTRLIARGPDGYFAVLPRHVDFVSTLDPGPLVYYDGQGEKQSLELAAGLMVKCGEDILVSAAAPVEAGAGLPPPDERERQALAVVASLEEEISSQYLRAREDD